MRIAYGIHGFGRGHAMRALAVLPELKRRHDVLVLAGDDAFQALTPEHEVVRIPVLKYYFNRRGKLSNWQSAKRNLPLLLESWVHGPGLDLVEGTIRDFRADVILTDSELLTHAVGRKCGIPRITFDHFGILVYCRPALPPGERLARWGNALVYKFLYREPEQAVVTAFFPAAPLRSGVHAVGAVIRQAVRETPAQPGDYLLAYVNKGEHEFTPQVEAAFKAAPCPVKVYGVPRSGRDGNLEYKPIANRPFIEDLAGCRAVYATCGNQLIGEVMHFGKPMLGQPMACFEQRLNAFQLERMGMGLGVKRGQLTAEVLRGFLARTDEFAANVARERRDGAAEALAAIEQCLKALGGAPATAPSDGRARPAGAVR